MSPDKAVLLKVQLVVATFDPRFMTIVMHADRSACDIYRFIYILIFLLCFGQVTLAAQTSKR